MKYFVVTKVQLKGDSYDSGNTLKCDVQTVDMYKTLKDAIETKKSLQQNHFKKFMIDTEKFYNFKISNNSKRLEAEFYNTNVVEDSKFRFTYNSAKCSEVFHVAITEESFVETDFLKLQQSKH